MAELHDESRPARRELSGLFSCARKLQLQRIALITVGLLNLQGCVTLPDAASEMAMPHTRRIEFEGPHGSVSAATSKVILVRLAGAAGASDVLQKHLAYEQALNADSPLVLGNKLTLLQNGPATYGAMFTAIRAAQDHINLETFIFDDDEAGKQFSDLLLERQAAGVQRRGAVMHAKTACIDDVWSTIGSTNLDWRSFLHNDEINAVILGRGFATQMEAMFAEDLQESDAIALDQWQHRPWLLRAKERMARVGAYWL
jgi:hypothetical protein